MNDYMKNYGDVESKWGMKKSKKKCVMIAILVFALLTSLCYIGYTEYQDNLTSLENEAYAQGVNDSAMYIYGNLVQVAAKCEPIPLRVNENVTINLIAVKCLQQETTKLEDKQNGNIR